MAVRSGQNYNASIKGLGFYIKNNKIKMKLFLLENIIEVSLKYSHILKNTNRNKKFNYLTMTSTY